MNRIQASFQNGLMEAGYFEQVGMESFHGANRNVDAFLEGFVSSMESIDDIKEKARDFTVKAVEVIKKLVKAAIDFIKMIGKKIADFVRDQGKKLSKKIDEFKRRGKPGDLFKTDATARIDEEELKSNLLENIAAGRTLFVRGSSVTGYGFAVAQFAGKSQVDYLHSSKEQYAWIDSLPVDESADRLVEAICRGLSKLGFFGLSGRDKLFGILDKIKNRVGFLEAYNEVQSNVYFKIVTLENIKNRDVIDATNRTVMRSGESINAHKKANSAIESHIFQFEMGAAVEEEVVKNIQASETAQAHWRQKADEAIKEIREKITLMRFLSSIITTYEYHRVAILGAQMTTYGQLMDQSYSEDMARAN